MKCGRADCKNVGLWRPVLMLHTKGHKSPPARFGVSTAVCDEHKSKNANVYLNDEAWKMFLEYFKDRKLQNPHRSLTEVVYESVEDAPEAMVH